MVYDVAIAWRIYPRVSKTPLIFPDNKFLLVKTCLQSFISSVRALKVRYFIILDGCPPSYTAIIEELLPAADTTIIHTPAIGNQLTFRMQVELLLQQNDAPLVYFAEDDYLYLPDAFAKMVALMNTCKEADFVSCYLHPDTFTHPIHRHRKKIIQAAGHQWMSDSSTCLTFLTTKKILQETKDVLLTFSKGNNDCAMWLVLTKTFVLNPFAYLRFFFTHQESFSIMKMAVKYSFRYFFFRRRYRLLVPVPAIGTHLEKDLVSPNIDWQKVSEALQ